MPEKSMCVYCKKPDEYSVCVYCDGKHTARNIFRRVGVERTDYVKRDAVQYFSEYNVKEMLMKRDIKGVEGLTENEKGIFWKAFGSEYSRKGAE